MSPAFLRQCKSTLLAAIFLSSQTIFIAILNGMRLDNAAILRIDDNVCASIAWFFIVKTIKEKKQQTSVEKAAMIAG
ncbi:hypothetical protein O5823_20410 [Escherichia coli]|nr:hypothetical protein [Escherichia coli]